MEIKIKTSLFVVLIVSLSLSKMGCESENVNDRGKLMKSWTRSYEEETAGMMMFPKSCATSKFCCVDGCAYISKSIAGATKTGHLAER